MARRAAGPRVQRAERDQGEVEGDLQGQGPARAQRVEDPLTVEDVCEREVFHQIPPVAGERGIAARPDDQDRQEVQRPQLRLHTLDERCVVGLPSLGGPVAEVGPDAHPDGGAEPGGPREVQARVVASARDLPHLVRQEPERGDAEPDRQPHRVEMDAAVGPGQCRGDGSGPEKEDGTIHRPIRKGACHAT